MACKTQSNILFNIYRGDDASFKVEVLDEDALPMDITGWSFKFTMKLSINDTDDDAALVTDIPALADTNAQAGILYIPITQIQTQDLLPAPYYFDIQREHNEQVTTIITGRLRVIADVTRRLG